MTNEYPYQIIEKRLGNTDVELVGVEHSSGFFYVWQDFFREKIEQSPEGIVFEGTGGEDFWECLFFGKLGEIAKKNKTYVYLADPISSNLNKACPDNLPELDLHLDYCSLKRLFYNYPLFIKSPTFDHQKEALVKSDQSLQLIDFRNVKIAEGIERIVKRDKPKKLTAFHGAWHTQPISFYLDNLEVRELKKEFYSEFEELGIKKVRKYKPLGIGSYRSWLLVKRF